MQQQQLHRQQQQQQQPATEKGNIIVISINSKDSIANIIINIHSHLQES